jgi:hypothetical protein
MVVIFTCIPARSAKSSSYFPATPRVGEVPVHGYQAQEKLSIISSRIEIHKDRIMTILRKILAILSLSLCAAAHAGTADDHFLLTPALVQKTKAAYAALEKANLPEQSEAEEKEDDKYRKNGELPVERFILSVEKRPGAKSIVARHGLSPKEFGLATYALIDASMYLVHEKMAGKAEAAKMQAKLTREQQENIALVRKLGPAASLNGQ